MHASLLARLSTLALTMALTTAVTMLLLTACSGRSEQAPSPPRTAADSQAAHIAEVVAAGGVVDSILPIAEHLRRFRATTAGEVDTLGHASPSITSLVERWATAIAAHDTSALNEMILDRAEFAWLYFPDAAIGKPPYEAPPELLWGQIMASSDEGIKRVFARLGGRRLRVAEVDCGSRVEIEGKNRVRQECRTRLVVDGRVHDGAQLFGSIIERDGRFKFIGYSNRL